MKGSRRGFIATSITTGAAGLTASAATGTEPEQPTQVDRRVFGRTGAKVSIYGLGLGSAFTKPFKEDPDGAAEVLTKALEFGINYWDTARAYGPSEELIGPVVEKHRDEIFLVSKSGKKDYDGFMRELEKSLKNLRTDVIDLYHMHNFQPNKGDTDAKAREGAWKAALKAKEEGMIKNFGVTGHSGAEILMEVIKAYDPDALLTTFPANRPDNGQYEDELLPLARSRNMGIIAMKTVRHVRNSDQPATELIRYGMSLPGVATVIVGIDSLEHLEQNAKLASGFKAWEEKKRSDFSQQVAMSIPSGLPQPWDLPGYNDAVV